MSIQTLTYAELAEIWGVSKDAARKKVEGLHLPRTRGNDGRARVQIDLEEVTHTPKAKPETTPGDLQDGASRDLPETGTPPGLEVRFLQERIAELQNDLEREREEYRANVDRERKERQAEREKVGNLSERLNDLERAKSEVEKLAALAHVEIGHRDSEIAALRSTLDEMRGRTWWRRLVG